MELAEPRRCDVDVRSGVLGNADHHYQKSLKDLTGLYSDEQAFKELVAVRGNDIVYEVTSYHPGSKTSDLILGITRLSPGKVANEYFMTRGHIHAIGDRPEIYYGQSGKGLMLMESPDGKMRICEVNEQSICYVPPFWIHRSVNVGAVDLVMMFTYPADSGQDYGIIDRSGGMRSRIVDDGAGGWTESENPNWKPRSMAEIEEILQTTGAVT
ncbi:MAG: glucose-6-phosphate isomerase [Proteobacteria bacterium]|nr:glucose-6-phosphate isomerase [Pseudomonadota bacterium]